MSFDLMVLPEVCTLPSLSGDIILSVFYVTNEMNLKFKPLISLLQMEMLHDHGHFDVEDLIILICLMNSRVHVLTWL